MSKYRERLSGLIKQLTHNFELRGHSHDLSLYEHRQLHFNGIDFSVSILENPSAKKTFVFMPGTNAYGLLYTDFLFALYHRGFNIVTFDPRGHGVSGGQPGGYTMEELVDDFQQVFNYALNRWGLPTMIGGSSQGGITAFYLAQKDSRVERVLCHNLADLSDDRSMELTRIPRLGKYLKRILPILNKFIPNLPFPMLGYLDLKREPVKGFKHAKEVIAKDPYVYPLISIRTLYSLAYCPPPKALSETEVPLFVLQAGEDTIFKTDYIRYIFNRIGSRDKTLKVYPGLPHYMIVDYVDEFIEDVAQWAMPREEVFRDQLQS